MKLKDTGLTAQDIKDKVKKYMIETYERFDFIAETAEGMYLYDENGTPYLDFYAGIAVNNAGSRNPIQNRCGFYRKEGNIFPDHRMEKAPSVHRIRQSHMDIRLPLFLRLP